MINLWVTGDLWVNGRRLGVPNLWHSKRVSAIDCNGARHFSNAANFGPSAQSRASSVGMRPKALATYFAALGSERVNKEGKKDGLRERKFAMRLQ